MKKQLDFKTIKITRVYQEKVSPVWVCIMEIEQVILNLLKNASQAMHAAKTNNPEIKLVIKQSTVDQVCLEIIDNGPGMPESVLKRIFEPFFTTKPVGEGTGLGLSVSFNLIKDHNHGSLTVESVENHGTKFVIILPTQEQQDKKNTPEKTG